MNTKPTPGPWNTRQSQDGSGDVGITAPGVRNVIAECFAAMRSGSEMARDEATANARLIAAAPDLLAALEGLVANPAFELGHAVFEGRTSKRKQAGLEAYDAAVVNARAALAKAKGDA